MKSVSLRAKSIGTIVVLIVITVVVLWHHPEYWYSGGQQYTTSVCELDRACNVLFVAQDTLMITLAPFEGVCSTILRYQHPDHEILQEKALAGYRCKTMFNRSLSPIYHDEQTNSAYTILNDADNNYLFTTLLKNGKHLTHMQKLFSHPLASALNDTVIVIKDIPFYPIRYSDKSALTPYKDGYRIEVASSQMQALRSINRTSIPADSLLSLLDASAVRQKLEINRYDLYTVISSMQRNHFYRSLRQHNDPNCGLFHASIMGRTDCNGDGYRDFIIGINGYRWIQDYILCYDALNDRILWQKEIAHRIMQMHTIIEDIDHDGFDEILFCTQAPCDQKPVDWYRYDDYNDNTYAYFYILTHQGEYDSHTTTPWVYRSGPGFLYQLFHLNNAKDKIILGTTADARHIDHQIVYLDVPSFTLHKTEISYPSLINFFEIDNTVYYDSHDQHIFSRTTLSPDIKAIKQTKLINASIDNKITSQVVQIHGEHYTVSINGQFFSVDGNSVISPSYPIKISGPVFTYNNAVYYIQKSFPSYSLHKITFTPNNRINPYIIIVLLIEMLVIGFIIHLSTILQTPMVSPRENYIFLYILFGCIRIWRVVGTMANHLRLPKSVTIQKNESAAMMHEITSNAPVISKKLNIFTTLQIFSIPSLDNLSIIQRIAHDIKNDLLVLKFQTDELNESLPDSRLHSLNHALAMISENARVLSDFSHISQLNLERIDLTELVENTVVEFFNHPQFINLRYQTHTPVLIEADQKLLHSALHNLISNALDATENNQEVQVSIATHTPDIAIIIQNPFTPDSRLTSKIGTIGFSTKSNGSGLGIAIARSICERHGGKLDIEIEDALFTAICTLPGETK